MKPRWRHPGATLFDHFEVVRQREVSRLTKRRAAVEKERELRSKHGPQSEPETKKRWRLPIGILRLSELKRLIRSRCNGPAETDDASLFLKVAIPSLIKEAKSIGTDAISAAILTFRRDWTPGVTDAEALAMVGDVERSILQGQPIHMKADQTAAVLSVTKEERDRLELRTIGAIGSSTRQRKQQRRARDRERKKAKRLALGMTPRSASKAATRPWETVGLGRSAYYEKLRTGELATRDKAKLDGFVRNRIEDPLTPQTELSETVYQSVADPARKASARHTVGAGVPTHRGKTRAVPPGRAVELPLPEGDIWAQGDLFGNCQHLGAIAMTVIAPLKGYEGGPLTDLQRKAVRDFLRLRQWTHRQFGERIGLSRQAVTNALRPQGKDGFGRIATVNMHRVIAASTVH